MSLIASGNALLVCGDDDSAAFLSRVRQIFPDDRSLESFLGYVEEAVHKQIRAHLLPALNKLRDGAAVADFELELRRFTAHAMCSIAVGRVPARLEQDPTRAAFKRVMVDAGCKSTGPEIGEFVLKVMDSRLVEALNGGCRHKRDLLSRLVSFSTDKCGGGDWMSLEGCAEINRDEILAITRDFLLAGVEALPPAMTKLFQLITGPGNEQCEAALFREVEGLRSYKNHYLLRRMDYTRACVSEALRILHQKAVVIGTRGSCLEEGEMFKPERWVDGRGYYVGAEDEWDFSPFGAGEGRRLWEEVAYAVMMSVTVAVVSHYKVEEVGSGAGGGGFNVRLSRRIKSEVKVES